MCDYATYKKNQRMKAPLISMLVLNACLIVALCFIWAKSLPSGYTPQACVNAKAKVPELKKFTLSTSVGVIPCEED